MCPIIRYMDTGTGPKLITADGLDYSWLGGFSHREMTETQSASYFKFIVSETTTIHLYMCRSRAFVTFNIM